MRELVGRRNRLPHPGGRGSVRREDEALQGDKKAGTLQGGPSEKTVIGTAILFRAAHVGLRELEQQFQSELNVPFGTGQGAGDLAKV
jgi:hypothetical protein